MHIEIYSREGCTYCDAAMDLTIQLVSDGWFGKLNEGLNWKHYDRVVHTYDKFTLDKDFSRNDMLHRFPMATTYPQILVDGEHIGGYTEYNEYVGRMDRVRHHPTDSH
jgi:glutaredoxin